MDIPQDWSKLPTKQVNLLLMKLLWNLKKYPIKKESAGKYCIANNITIEPEWHTVETVYVHMGHTYKGVGYCSTRYKINGKSVTASAMLPSILYRICEKRAR